MHSANNSPSHTRRHPDACPKHPGQIVYYSTTQQTSEANIIQHRCAQDRCNEPIGWYFTGSKSWRMPFAHGPGLCNDRQILDRMDRDRYDGHTYGTAMMLVSLVIATALTGSLLAFNTGHPPIWTVVTASAMLAAAAAVYRCFRNRRRPQHLENTSA